MPNGGEIYMLGPVKTTKLAPSSQLGHYFSVSDLAGGHVGGQNPFPLRTSSVFSSGNKSPTTTPNAPFTAQSILSSRRLSRNNSRPSVERSDSLEDHLGSEGSEEDDEAFAVRLKQPPRGDVRHKPHFRATSAFAPCLRHLPRNSSKKSVRFADDYGLDLSRTHLFNSLDDDLGDWEPDPLPRADYGKIENDSADDLVVEISEWQVNFSQPAADYLGFREKLETNNVALENVIIKQKENSFMGTIKVKNIAFKKDVFVRCSFNGWETFSDFPAKFFNTIPDGGVGYDTFKFEVIIPEEAEKRQFVEFCICLRTDGREFWDSNNGKNYQLITNAMKYKKSKEKYTDAYTIDTAKASWGEFASWNQLENSQPYW